MINITIDKRHVYALAALIIAIAVIIPTASWASHTFDDVPDDNTFHDDIDWLAATGVTKGCNPPSNTEFCPDDPVTRQTMAAFLKRLAENQVVDAGSVDGYNASDLVAAYGWSTPAILDDVQTTPVSVFDETVNASVPSVVVVSGNVAVEDDGSIGGAGVARAILRVNGVEVSQVAVGLATYNGPAARQHLAVHGVAEIPAGASSIEITLTGGTGGVWVGSGQTMSAIVTPFGGAPTVLSAGDSNQTQEP